MRVRAAWWLLNDGLALSPGGKVCAISPGFKLHSFTFFFSWHYGSNLEPSTDSRSGQLPRSQATSGPELF